MQHRLLTPVLNAALAERPVVLLQGPRQAGKTTLAQSVAARRQMRYLTFDDMSVLSSARGDPAGFLAGLEGPVVLDEVQRVPELFSAIKLAVDRNRKPGRFLLTSSADVLALPRLSESLAGRMELLTLWPLSEAEISGTVGNFVTTLFGDALPRPKPADPEGSLAGRILRGGFPEVATGTVTRLDAWFGSYLTTILQRDVRDLANVEDLPALPRLLGLIASRPAGLLSYAGLSRDSGLAASTLKRYFALLENTFIVRSISSWHGNVGQRLVKAPKVVLTDSGLASHLLGLDPDRLRRDPRLFGGLLEGFVGMELTKQAGWAEVRVAIHHFRSHAGEEVDLVLEGPGGDLVGVEVKAKAAVTAEDFRGLKALAELAKKRFLRGVILYTGSEVVPFGRGLEARPVQELWN